MLSHKNLTPALKAPFPAFGGKSQVADLVWSRFGDVRNYVEGFAFSAAMLLRRPAPGAIETINDLNSYVANFWRAVQADPEAVAAHADWPVNEDDLHARHRWLVTSAEAVNKLKRVRAEPDYFDARIAGWWCWGACMWIGSGWCEERGAVSTQIPVLAGHSGQPGKGVHNMHQAGQWHQRPDLEEHQRGVGRILREQIPTLEMCAGGGKGVNGVGPTDTGRPVITDAYSRGRGVNGNDAASVCGDRRAWLVDWMQRLADRLRPVRVCCGHWARVCDSDSTLTRLGTTAVFLDPPYRPTVDGKASRTKHLYANDKHQDVNALVDEVQAWCLKWGGSLDIRIAVCGLEGEYPLLDAAGWEKVPWKSRGGYGNRTVGGKENAARERIWFNASCVPAVAAPDLFTPSGWVIADPADNVAVRVDDGRVTDAPVTAEGERAA